MAKKNKKKTPSSLEIVKKKYSSFYVAGGAKWDSKILDTIFLVASPREGIRFVKEMQGRVIEIERMGWNELPEELEADQMFTERKYLHNELPHKSWT